jgi:hypothetical protein
VPRPSIVLCHASTNRGRNLYWVKAHNELSRSPFSQHCRVDGVETPKVPTKNNNKQHTWEASTNSNSRVVTMLKQILFFLLGSPRKACLRVYWHSERTSHSRESYEKEEPFRKLWQKYSLKGGGKQHNSESWLLHAESSSRVGACVLCINSARRISIRFRWLGLWKP